MAIVVGIGISIISMMSISVVVSIVIARISLCLSFTCHSSKQTQRCNSNGFHHFRCL